MFRRFRIIKGHPFQFTMAIRFQLSLILSLNPKRTLFVTKQSSSFFRLRFFIEDITHVLIPFGKIQHMQEKMDKNEEFLFIVTGEIKK